MAIPQPPTVRENPPRWRRAGAAVCLGALVVVTLTWMLFALSVSPFHSVLGTLGIDLLESDDAFCLRDAGHWLQLIPAAAGLFAASTAARRLWRTAGGGTGRAAAPALFAFVALLVAWVAVYTFVGDCGWGSEDG